MRLHLFEFEDLPWFPNVLRQGMTDYLRYLLPALRMYDSAVSLLMKVMENTASIRIIDLCSGGGGAIEAIGKGLSASGNYSILLTERYPNVDAFNTIKNRSDGHISYFPGPVDAAGVPESLTGVRTMFSAFHHFQPAKAREVLANAVQHNAPVAFFDGGEKNLAVMLGILILHPVAFVLFTPFFKPFRWSRLVFTYAVPLIPLCTVWDGLVSILRLYTPRQMRKLGEEAAAGKYDWESGVVKGKTGFRIAYLLGWPKNVNA